MASLPLGASIVRTDKRSKAEHINLRAAALHSKTVEQGLDVVSVDAKGVPKKVSRRDIRYLELTGLVRLE